MKLRPWTGGSFCINLYTYIYISCGDQQGKDQELAVQSRYLIATSHSLFLGPIKFSQIKDTKITYKYAIHIHTSEFLAFATFLLLIETYRNVHPVHVLR
jgi:hypothetical protein